MQCSARMPTMALGKPKQDPSHIKYSRVRSKIHGGKVDVVKLILAGWELQDFSAVVNFETTASLLAFAFLEVGFQELLLLD